MPVPTRRLALVALLLAGVRLLLPDVPIVQGLLVLNGLLLAVAAADWLLAPAPGRIGVERSLPAVLTIDQRGEVSWRVTNPTRRRLHVVVADELAPSLHASMRRATMAVPASGAATVRTPIRPVRRGRFTPREVVVRVEGPLGLAARQRRRLLPATLRVHPPFRSKDEAELRINRARVLEVGLRSAQGRGGGTEFESLREYSTDDEFRRVDWSATARAGKPIVRTYRAERNQTVIVLLDNGRVMAGRVEEVPRVEHAMDATMMLATVATRLGDKCGLMVFDAKVRAVLEPSKARAQVGRVTESLFDLEPQLVETDYRGAFAEAVVRFRRRAMLVLLTELNEQAAEEYLVPALPLIARSHLIVVGAVRDPEVERWAGASTVDPESAYRRAAAIGALAGTRSPVGPAPQPGRHGRRRRARQAVRRPRRHVPQAEGNRPPVTTASSPKRPVRPRATASRPRVTIQKMNASSTSTPMPTRTDTGKSLGVTKPSMRPATMKQSIRPSTITTERRPSSASASPRGRSPGAITVHPRRNPAAPATTIAVNSSRPWGRISPKNFPS